MEDMLSKTKDHNFGLFFTTQGRSLQNWDRLGMLEREIKLYQHIAQYFRKLYIFTYGSKKDCEYKNLFPENVVIVPKPKFLPVLLYSFLMPFIHAKKMRALSILKTNQMDGAWAAVIAKKLYGGRLIVRCGYEWLFTLEQLKKSFMKLSFAKKVESLAYMSADKIVFTSESAMKYAVDKFNLNQNKICIIPNYIDTEVFQPCREVRIPNRIIFVGRIEKEKNISSLIYAMKGVDVHLVLVGKGTMNNYIRQLCQKEKVAVEFKGVVDNKVLPDELQKSDMFILPSLYEGNPKALLEAMSCGLPCIGTNVAGIKDLIEHGKTGVLCDTNTESIHRAIIMLISDHRLKEQIGVNARKKIEEEFSFEVIMKREKDIYDYLLQVQ